jgi:hypothetical protein
MVLHRASSHRECDLTALRMAAGSDRSAAIVFPSKAFPPDRERSAQPPGSAIHDCCTITSPRYPLRSRHLRWAALRRVALTDTLIVLGSER